MFRYHLVINGPRGRRDDPENDIRDRILYENIKGLMANGATYRAAVAMTAERLGGQTRVEAGLPPLSQGVKESGYIFPTTHRGIVDRGSSTTRKLIRVSTKF